MKRSIIRACVSLAAFAAASCGQQGDTFTGLVAGPGADEAKGTLLFLPGEGLGVETFDGLASALGEKGWRVFVFAGGEKDWKKGLASHLDKEHCTIVGGFGSGATYALDVASEQDGKGVIDGVIMLAGLKREEANYMTVETKATLITAEFDPAASYEASQAQGTKLPGRSTFLRIKGANRAGFAPGASFEGDGEATMPVEEQQRITAELFDYHMGEYCAARSLPPNED